MRFRRHLSRIVCAIVLATLSIAVAQPADAQSRRKKDKQKNQYVIRDQRIAKKFVKIQEKIDAEQLDDARKILDSINLKKVKPYPRALVHQTYAFLAGNADDYKTAAKHYQLAISENALPPQRLLGIRFNLGQIYMMEDDWPKAIETLESWFEDTEKPSPMSYYMLAVAYYQNDERDKALAPAKKAVELAEDPKETWLQLLLSLHMDKEEYKEAEPLLVRLITHHSKKIYWIQLAAVLMELEQDKKSLAVQQLAYDQGYLSTDRELIRLSQMYLFHDLPFRAAQVLSKELENGRVESDYDAWRLYSNALLSSREMAQALEPLETAARLAENGEGYLQLSQVHIQNERWDEARSALDSAFQKGDLRSPAHANLLLGIVAYQQKRWGGARAAFGRATRDDKTREMASKWIEFVDREEASDAARKASTEAARAAAEEARAELAEEAKAEEAEAEKAEAEQAEAAPVEGEAAAG
jgi:tetratricopeptide (TPR) repeat protein